MKNPNTKGSLVAAVKELAAIVQAQSVTIAALEARVAALEG